MNAVNPLNPINPPVAINPVVQPQTIPASIPPSAATLAPDSSANQTIYINNLNSKIKRDDLKKSLYAVFVQFGQILDIVTGKCMKMNGQAFVVFADLSSATNAIRAMQGFPLYEKPMRIQFARKDSDIIAKQKGTFVERPRVERPKRSNKASDDAMASAAQHALESQAGQGGQSARAIRRRMQREAAAAATGAVPAQSNGVAVPPPPGMRNGTAPGHPAYPGGPTAPNSYSAYHPAPPAPGTYAPPPPPPGQHPMAPAAPPPAPNLAQIPDQPPNKILFVTNLPQNADEAMLSMLFTQFAGFREVRMVSSRSDIAFVEFGNETEAGIAKHGLQGFSIRPGHPIRITFAKK